jgi:alpha-glucosidase
VSAPSALHTGGDTTGLRALPVFARAGAVIPMQPVMSYVGARAVDTIQLHVFPGAATSELYEDAGDGYGYERGQFRRTTFRTTGDGGTAGVTIARTGTFAGARTFAVTLHAAERPRAVTVDGRTVAVQYDGGRREATFAVPSSATRVDVAR